MDYEKKYKNALEWARQVMNGEIGFVRKEVEKVFSELKESEDEKIRKALIKYYSFDKGGGSHALDNITPKQIVAWLEKQGEKDEEILILKDQIESLHAAIKALKEAHKIELKKQGEQKLIDTTNEQKFIEDLTQQGAMDIAVAKCFDEQKPYGQREECKDCQMNYAGEYGGSCVLKKREQNFVEWSKEDEEIRSALIKYLGSSDALSVDLASAIYWLKSLRPKSNQEVDEQIETIAMHLDNCGDTAMAEILRSCNLRPQNHWKPSDEQMNALREAVFEMGKSVSRCSIEEFHGIESLYNDLKKLREE